MFDVSFWELAVIFVVGLLVLGPERLPKAAQQIGQWAGKARRMARLLTTQLQDELNAVDPNRIMDPQPTRRPSPPPAYNRPGMDDLIPGDPEPVRPAPKPVAETAEGLAEKRADSTPGNVQP